jgi:hypothetical protein
VTTSCSEALSCRKGRLEKFDRFFHRIKKDAEGDYYNSGEHIHPIFSMKGGITVFHVASL